MLRDRRSLAVMFGIPLVLYPVLTIALAGLAGSRIAGLKEQRYNVVVLNPAAAPELMRRLGDEKSGLRLVEPPAATTAPATAATVTAPAGDELNRSLARGRIDAVLEIPPGFEPDVLAGKDAPLSVRLNHGRTEAEFASRKLDRVLDGYQEWVIARRLSRYDVPTAVTKGIERKLIDVATQEQRMGKMLSQLMPLLILVTGMLGALFPALAATTTERELGTLETLLVTPATRGELLISKGLLVLLCGVLTGAINCISMSLVLLRVSTLGKDADKLSIDFGSLAMCFVAALPALAFFTALVLLVGLLARTFKEANSYATPAMLLPVASMALTIAEVQVTPGLLVTPIANTTLVMRDVLRGQTHLGHLAVASISSFLYAGLLLSVAARLFSNEQLVNPSWEPLSLKGLGSIGRGKSSKRPPRLPAVDEAIALFAIALLLLFYVQPSLMKLGLIPTIIITQVFLLFAPAVVMAWLGNWHWRDTFQLRVPRPAATGGAILLGIGLAPVVGLVSYFQNKFWPPPETTQKFVNELFVPALQAHPFLIPIIVGVFAGVFEELLFRGPIQTALLRKARPATAIIITAVIFAAAHLDLHGLPLRTILGLVLGWVVYRSGSILPAILIHVLYDATQLAIAAWQVHHEDPAAPATLDKWFWLRFGVGAVIAVVGYLLIRRRRISAAQGPTEVQPIQGTTATSH